MKKSKCNINYILINYANIQKKKNRASFFNNTNFLPHSKNVGKSYNCA